MTAHHDWLETRRGAWPDNYNASEFGSVVDTRCVQPQAPKSKKTGNERKAREARFVVVKFWAKQDLFSASAKTHMWKVENWVPAKNLCWYPLILFRSSQKVGKLCALPEIWASRQKIDVQELAQVWDARQLLWWLSSTAPNYRDLQVFQSNKGNVPSLNDSRKGCQNALLSGECETFNFCGRIRRLLSTENLLTNHGQGKEHFQGSASKIEHRKLIFFE